MKQVDFNIAIGKKIRNKRNELNMTMKELGKLVDLSEATIQRYESGKIKGVGIDKVALIAKALDVTPAYLMGWEEDTTEPEDETSEKVKVLAREAGDLSDVQIDLLRSMIKQFKEGKR